MIRKFIAAFALMFFVISSTAFAAEDETKIITFDGVTVEYPKDFYYGLPATKDGVIFAHGVATGPMNWDKQDSFYKTFARQAARLDSLRSLAEEIGGVIVKRDQTNANNLSMQVSHDSKAFKLLKENARQVGEATFYSGGVCELFMAIRLEPRK